MIYCFRNITKTLQSFNFSLTTMHISCIDVHIINRLFEDSKAAITPEMVLKEM